MIKAGIVGGALLPLIAMAESGANAPEEQVHWAWSKLVRPALPDPGAGQARTPVDHFTFARMAEKGIQPAPEASPRALLRRVHLDLTGLPPSPEEVEAFLRDPGEIGRASCRERV